SAKLICTCCYVIYMQHPALWCLVIAIHAGTFHNRSPILGFQFDMCLICFYALTECYYGFKCQGTEVTQKWKFEHLLIVPKCTLSIYTQYIINEISPNCVL